MPARPGPYDDLIDAERAALVRSGEPAAKIALIVALREATGLDLKDAKEAVDDYLVRRDDRTTWIDDLLDAERAAATRDDRPINKIVLIKTLREASSLGLKDAKLAVEDYLRRRGGEGLPSGSRAGGVVALVVFGLIVAVGVALLLSR